MSIDETSVATEAADVPVQAAPSTVNRRTLMKTAAGAGFAVAAVGIVGVAHASGTTQPTAAGIAAGAPLSGAAEGTSVSSGAAPLVVHVSDLGQGTLDIFTNGARTQVTDVDLARRIARAAN